MAPQYLKGITVLELAGLAPGPLCGQMFADYGARVIRVDRPAPIASGGDSDLSFVPPTDQLTRGKESVILDLQTKRGRAILKEMLSNTDPSNGRPIVDVLIDTYRPGVLERLDVLPFGVTASKDNLKKVSQKKTSKLIVARLTGYGQTAGHHPYSHFAGHDINYLAASGVLDITGSSKTPPTAPANVLGDFAGLALPGFAAVLVALLGARNGTDGDDDPGKENNERRVEFIDVNIVESIRYLAQYASYGKYGSFNPNQDQDQDKEESESGKSWWWSFDRGDNILEGSTCPYYTIYETGDVEKYVSVGALEQKFYAAFLKLMNLTDSDLLLPREDPQNWASLKLLFASKFKAHSFDYWIQKTQDSPDACVMPVHELATPDLIPDAIVSGFSVSTQHQHKLQTKPRPVKGGHFIKPGRDSETVLDEFLGPGWQKNFNHVDEARKRNSKI